MCRNNTIYACTIKILQQKMFRKAFMLINAKNIQFFESLLKYISFVKKRNGITWKFIPPCFSFLCICSTSNERWISYHYILCTFSSIYFSIFFIALFSILAKISHSFRKLFSLFNSAIFVDILMRYMLY